MAYQDDILALSPELYWRFQETSGTQATDASGNGHHGTINGCTLAVPGPIVGTVALGGNGLTTDYVQANSLPSGMSGAANYSIVMFIRFETGSTDERYAMSINGDSNNVIYLWYGGSDGQLDYRCRSSNTGSIETNINTSNHSWIGWRHLVITQGATCRFYVDGVERYNDSSESDFPVLSSQTLQIGSSGWKGLVNGAIAEFALIPSELNSTQVANLAAYLDPDPSPPTVWYDALSRRLPRWWFRMDESSGNLINLAGSHQLNVSGTPTYSRTGATGDGNTGILFDGSTDYFTSASGFEPINVFFDNGWTIGFWMKSSRTSGVRYVCTFGPPGVNNTWYIQANRYELLFNVKNFLGNYFHLVSSGLDLEEWSLVVWTFTDATADHKLYVDGSLVHTEPSFSDLGASNMDFNLGHNGSGLLTWDGELDDFFAMDGVLSDADILELYNVASTSPAFDQNIPMRLRGWLSSSLQNVPVRLRGFTYGAAATVPLRLKTSVVTAAQNMSMRARSPDPTHYQADSAAWTPKVVLDTTDISSSLVNRVSIQHEEFASGICEFDFLPPAGNVDPNDYERKAVTVDYEGRDSAGALLYSSRRYTGVTTIARYDPDSGIMTITATTDLQGRLEQLTRPQIDSLVGGYWSEHIFDDTADGYQYALDRLSTIPSEIHVNNYGTMVVIPFGAGGVSATLTDSERFNDTLRLQRASRRDLLSRMKINMDFRFTRLRHREIQMIYYGPTFCDYLDGKGGVATKEVIQSAADGNEWVRISPIAFVDLPDTGTYCGGKNWVAYESEPFTLEARWRMARRWAQYVTEQYEIDIYSPDIEEAIGQQLLSEDYGVEAVYDATDFEQIKNYTAAPTGAALSSKSNDWQYDAVEAERTGRVAVQAAQVCAIERAKTTILKRARRNTASVGNVYDPSITLEKTVRINTPHFVCTGKVRAIRETLNINTGEPSMFLDLALSRHGGSGLGVTTPTVNPDVPEQSQEESTSRTYFMGWRAGGKTTSLADDDDWEGWVTNAYGAERTDPTKMYRERFVINMPPIEEAARQATEEQATQSFELAVPEDELTMSN